MQIDSYHATTYVVAREAGFSHDDADVDDVATVTASNKTRLSLLPDASPLSSRKGGLPMCCAME